jgi:hypothetical protein
MEKAERDNIEIRSTAPIPSARLVTAAKLLEAARLTGQRPWEEYIACALQGLKATRPDKSTDILTDADDPSVVIPHPSDEPDRHDGLPRVHYGKIASANKLLKNAKLRNKLRDQYGAIAVEMEASGIADATWIGGARGYLIVRGICDYCNESKGDSWQAYAAAAAASYVRALIESLPPPEHQPDATLTDYSTPRSAGHAELARLIHLSHVASEDSANIQSDRLGLGYGPAVQLGDVYVPRRIEAEVDLWLAKPEGEAANVIAIVGPAGYGKTSVLWNTFRRLSTSDNLAPIFIKASWLFHAAPAHALTVSAPEILVAANHVAREGKRMVILLDTVDLLLHNESQRFHLHELLSNAVDAGAQVVFTTRPEEIRRYPIPSAGLKWIDLIITKYDDEEFPIAIRQYVSAFYRNSDDVDSVSESERIKDAVSNGRPLREVCLNPLSLRMLFSLYAPHEISTEVNVFQLYCDYWRVRVESDVRAGELWPQATMDLSGVAFNIALAMLAKGSPVLFHEHLPQLLDAHYVTAGGLRALATRGVLINTGHSAIEFFHQTFFEHAAARAALARARQVAIDDFEYRMVARPNDLFVAPVYEQLLLFALAHRGPERDRAATALLGLLDPLRPAFWTSALNVYVLGNDISEAVQGRVNVLLDAGDESLIKRFIEVVPNMVLSRAPEVMRHLRTIWKHESWRTKQHTLRLILWLVNASWPLGRQFIEQSDVFTYFLRNAPTEYAIDRDLLAIIGVGVRGDITWAREQTLKICENSRISPARLVEFAARYPSLFASATFCQEIMAHLYAHARAHSSGGGIPYIELGQILCLDWKISNLPIESIFDRIRTSTGVEFRAEVCGVMQLVSMDSRALSQVLYYIDAEMALDRYWTWLDGFVKPILKQSLTRPSDSGASLRAIAFDWVRVRASEAFVEQLSGVKHSAKWSMFVTFLSSSDLTALEKQQVLSVLATQVEGIDPWLDIKLLGNFVADALTLGWPQADEVVGRLTRDVSANPLVSRALRVGLQEEHFFYNQHTVSVGIEWCKASNDITLLSAAAARATETQLLALQQHLTAVTSLINLAISSPYPAQRSRSADLWSRLAAFGQLPGPEPEWLSVHLIRERDAGAKDALCRLASFVQLHRDFNVLNLITLLVQADTGAVSRTRALIGAIVSLLKRHAGTPVQHVTLVMELILRAGADEWQLRQFGAVLQSLVESRAIDDANRLALDFLQHDAVRDLGVTGKRALEHHLSKPFGALFSYLPKSEQINYLELLPRLDRHLGRLIVNAACRTALGSLRVELDTIIAPESVVSGDLKVLINRYRQEQEGAQGGDNWPNVEAYLHAVPLEA